ncbi:hypothetical protein Tco_0511576 [Tanacetum coccineum]
MLKKERVDERLIEKIDISFALTIDMHMILSRQRWMIGNLKVWVQSRRQLVAEERKCLVMDSEKNERYNKPAAGEQSHDEVYGCLKGGSGNSGGKRLAISMVEEAWLSEKKENVFVEEKECFRRRERMFSSKRKNVSLKRKNVSGKEKECFRQREMESVLTNVVKRLE